MNMILKDNNEGIEFELTNGTWMMRTDVVEKRDITAAANIGMPLSDNGF